MKDGKVMGMSTFTLQLQQQLNKRTICNSFEGVEARGRERQLEIDDICESSNMSGKCLMQFYIIQVLMSCMLHFFQLRYRTWVQYRLGKFLSVTSLELHGILLCYTQTLLMV